MQKVSDNNQPYKILVGKLFVKNKEIFCLYFGGGEGGGVKEVIARNLEKNSGGVFFF